MSKILEFVKKELVLTVSFILGLISMIFVPVDRNYISYIDFRTLSILFCLMVIMAGLQRLHIFRQIGEELIAKVSNLRSIAFTLILLCFFFSMFITNDVALLTFVPFTIVVLHMANQEGALIPIIVLETLAANLGSMMLPMGNPQNLYLYSLTDLSLPAFVLLMLPYGALSFLAICVICVVCVKKAEVCTPERGKYHRTKREKRRFVAYLVLFLVSLLTVARVIDYPISFLIVLIGVLIFDRDILAVVDYSLLFTFFFLFIFIGNLKRMDVISNMLSQIVVGNEVLTSVIASQCISNVPAAILLSGFTSNIQDLIIGTNLGGLGTLIASMASLISFKQYSCLENADRKKYLGLFTLTNLGILALLLLLNLLLQ